MQHQMLDGNTAAADQYQLEQERLEKDWEINKNYREYLIDLKAEELMANPEEFFEALYSLDDFYDHKYLHALIVNQKDKTLGESIRDVVEDRIKSRAKQEIEG